MTKYLVLFSLFAFILFTPGVASTTFTYAATNPLCAAPGQLTLGINLQSQANTINFDVMSTFYNQNQESVPLMVKSGDSIAVPPVDFKFYSYNNDLTDITAQVCTGTAAFTYVDVVGQFLFLHDDGSSAYVVCKYDPTGTSTPITLTATGIVTGSVSQFDPYMVNGDVLFVLVGDGTTNQIVSYDVSGSSPITGTQVSGQIDHSLLTAKGNQAFLYDQAASTFLKYSETAWVADTVIGSVSGKIVKVYNLREKNVFVNVLSISKLQSSLYSVAGNTATSVVSATNTNHEIQAYTDWVNEFVHISEIQLTWLTLPKTGTTLYMTEISNTQNLNLGKILNVALSKNKAVILYSDSRLEYLQHTAAGAIKVLFTKSYNSGDMTLTDGNQYKLQISCMCAAVDKFACFAATLNCVIIKKAGVSCHSGTDTATTW